jgi:S-adenosylmethionine-dependent methyltransferase
MSTSSYHQSGLEQGVINLESRSKTMEQRSAEPWAAMLAEVALDNILAHLPAGRVLRVLDIGDGRCWYAIEMAKRGCFVELVYSSDKALENAHRQIVTAGLGERIRISKGDFVNELANYRAASFNVVFAHLLLEYLPDHAYMIEQISRLLKPDGLLSLMYENRYASIMRMALKGQDPRAALELLTRQDRIIEAPADEGFTLAPEQVNRIVEQKGLHIVADYGVGIFSEFASVDKFKHNPDFAATLRELERTAAPMPQYRGIARYRHLLGVKK